MLIMNCRIPPYVTLIQSIISGKRVYLVGRGYGRITLRWIISQAGCGDGGGGWTCLSIVSSVELRYYPCCSVGLWHQRIKSNRTGNMIQQTILMWSNFREGKHVLLVNTACLYLQSDCATGVSSGRATRVTWSGWKNLLHEGGPTSDLPFEPR
jgi:hypothetical protein